MLRNETSICQYVNEKNHSDLEMNYFVYEPHPIDDVEWEEMPSYYLFCVTQGKGEVTSEYGRIEFEAGDLFFTFPQKKYKFRKITDDWQYIYISFCGTRAKHLLERARVNYVDFGRYKYSFLIGEWKHEFKRARISQCPDLVAESLLFRTLSYFNQNAVSEDISDPRRELVERMIAFIDDNYTDSSLSLKTLSSVFHFTPNYLSYTFKNYMNTGFSHYLKHKRIKQATALLCNTSLSVKDVAHAVGFEDALYFTRAFKEIILKTPSEYRKGQK